MTRLAKATAIVAATLLGLATLWELRGPVLVLLLSLIVAAAARTPVDYLAGRGLPKIRGAGRNLRGELADPGGPRAGNDLPGERRAWAGRRRISDDSTIMPPSTRRPCPGSSAWPTTSPPADELLTALVGQHGEQAVRLVLGTAFGILSAVIDVVFVVVLSIYWTIDREYFERLWLSLLPLPHRVSARKLWRMLEAELGAYVRSEITQSLLAGIVLGVAFYLLGPELPHPAGAGRRLELVDSVARGDHRAVGVGGGRIAASGPRLARLACSRLSRRRCSRWSYS